MGVILWSKVEWVVGCGKISVVLKKNVNKDIYAQAVFFCLFVFNFTCRGLSV